MSPETPITVTHPVGGVEFEQQNSTGAKVVVVVGAAVVDVVVLVLVVLVDVVVLVEVVVVVMHFGSFIS